MYMTLRQPCTLAGPVDPGGKRSERARRVTNETVTGGQIAVGGYAQIARSRAARIGPVGTLVDLLQREQQVGKWIALARYGAPFESLSPQATIASSMAARLSRVISPRPLGALSSGEKPTL